MRLFSLLALGALSAALAGPAAPAADSPDALLRPLAPPDKTVRVRLPVSGAKMGPVRVPAQVPSGKKPGEYIDIMVAVGTGGESLVPEEALADWGYAAKAGGRFKLPEVRFPGVQIAPAARPKDGTDVAPRLTGVTLAVVAPPVEPKNMVFDADLLLCEADLCQVGGAARTGPEGQAAWAAGLKKARPRLAFDDAFLELTVPSSAAALKRFGTSDGTAREATARPAAGLAAVVAPTDRQTDAFLFAAVNGKSAYKSGSKTRAVSAIVSPTNNWPTGIVIDAGVARGCGVEWDERAEGVGAAGPRGRSKMVPGTVKELRIGFLVDGDPKKPVDFVLADVKVMVDPGDSGSTVSLGPRFFEAHLTDAVYAADDRGGWNLYARCDEKKYLRPHPAPEPKGK